MQTRILHISDLHINDILSGTENLRKNRYKEFIDDLYESYSKFHGEQLQVDYLLVTGDFVNKGLVENFDHAENVINHLIATFNIKEGHTFVCIGNHDIIRSEDKLGNLENSIKDYKKFERKFNGRTYPEKVLDNRASIFKAGNDYILILDPVSNNKGTDKPVGELLDDLIDLIASEWIRDSIPSDSNLYILCHYPLIHSQKNLLDYEENDWTGRHIWTAGHPLKERILKIRGKGAGKTIWFFGDAHLPDLVQDDSKPSIIYLMTGQFGGNYTNPVAGGQAYKLYHQATVLDITDSHITRVVFSYEPQAFKFSAHLGNWNPAKTTIKLESLISPASIKMANKFIVPVGSSIEEEIYDEIKKEELYKFGKFVTSETNVSLGWVSINNLFANTVLLSNGIDKITEWLKNNIQLNNHSELFIGCGFWGGILAANVAVRTNMTAHTISSFVTTPAKCAHEESVEFLFKKLTNLDKLKRIIVFTDVVSSGETMVHLKEKIERLTVKKYEFVAITALVDENNISQEFTNDFRICAALCTKLKMPIIERSLLPDDDIYPPRLDFTTE